MKALARRILEKLQESDNILAFYGEGFRDSRGRFLIKRDNEFYSFVYIDKPRLEPEIKEEDLKKLNPLEERIIRGILYWVFSRDINKQDIFDDYFTGVEIPSKYRKVREKTLYRKVRKDDFEKPLLKYSSWTTSKKTANLLFRDQDRILIEKPVSELNIFINLNHKDFKGLGVQGENEVIVQNY